LILNNQIKVLQHDYELCCRYIAITNNMIAAAEEDQQYLSLCDEKELLTRQYNITGLYYALLYK